jgi:hypothetical protein
LGVYGADAKEQQPEEKQDFHEWRLMVLGLRRHLSLSRGEAGGQAKH